MSMELIVGIIAAIASVIAAIYAVRNDKAHIRKNIRKKQDKIQELEMQKIRKYNNRLIKGTITPEDEKISKIKQEISDLEDRL